MSFHKAPSVKTKLDEFTYPIAGSSDERPKSLSFGEAGVRFFDQNLQKLLIWNGAAWVTANGEPVADPAPPVEEAPAVPPVEVPAAPAVPPATPTVPPEVPAPPADKTGPPANAGTLNIQ